ncbi:MAG: tol-pal system protein YbgF [Alcanivorax sp.]|nr:tol-pal system protein YbgF [Alcanivorax sp.]
MKSVNIRRLLAGATFSALSLCAYAQSTGPLAVEDRSFGDSQADTRSASNNNQDPDSGLVVLMQQQDQLQDQIQQLQGQVEELRHQLQTMKDAERERYLDLDTRINTLAEQGKTETPETGAADDGSTDPQADRDAYDAARDQLLKRDFTAAASAFENYLKDFPHGKYRGHAHFWLGKVYSSLPKPELDKAREQFQAVVDEHPDHSKAPASLYTLAVMDARAGKVPQAKVELHKLIKQYPDTSEAGQAKTLLDQLSQ